MSNNIVATLKDKAAWVWRETLLLQKRSPEARVASSLSAVETLVTMYYGEILRYQPKDPYWPGRDRFVISKGHGSLCMYPILADLGYFDYAEVERMGSEDSILGTIPDPAVPGYETINGSLGHGLGVCCGMAIALKRSHSSSHVYVMVGDGELYEGSCWEAIMFAGHHRLDNVTLIVDKNRASMLDFCDNVIAMDPLTAKLSAFGWEVEEVDGHDVEALHGYFVARRGKRVGKPSVVVAHTAKGHGVPALEDDPLCHIKSVASDTIDVLVETRR